MLRPLAIATLSCASLAPAAERVGFNRDIRPILSDRCFFCHGPDENKRKGDLRLDTREGALADLGGHAAIVPGKPDESELLHRVRSDDPDEFMPQPKSKKPRLSADEVELFRRWIEQGAEYQGHWAFEPIGDPRVPESDFDNPIDAFVRARLAREGIEASPRADRHTLIRRAYLDLIGLLPTPEQVAAFVADNTPAAYEKLVDELLASPHYGERWGRHWLDGARYADSHGYSIDGDRQMWPYRDWVIKALNDDMPFDQFTVEQIAGDLLPDATKSQIVASAFHRNTLINQEGGSDPEQFRVEATMDRVSTTGAVWLALTVGCAQCHTHKFDPIPHQDYYRLFAFFNSAEDRNNTGPTVEVAEGEMFGTGAAGAKPVKLMVMRDAKTPRETYVLTRGDFTRPDKERGVQKAGVLSAIAPALPEIDRPRNRLDLARWLVSPDNPLTARVTVNRVWMRYFGIGLVETEEDFGHQGSPPSHPELLDYLARRFVADGWSMKKLHRLIVTSETYRASSHARPDLATKDPRNLLLARQSRLRLDAEIIRDAALSASGLLNPKLGGPGVRPPQPDGIYAFTQNKKSWNTSTGPERFRRGMYTVFYRSAPYPLFSTFDAPDFQTACTRRARSNTPLQALNIANDPAFIEFAQALAARAIEERPGDPGEQLDARINRAFELALCRPAGARELAVLRAYALATAAEFSADPAAAKSLLTRRLIEAGSPPGPTAAALVATARAILNTDNFITRE